MKFNITDVSATIDAVQVEADTVEELIKSVEEAFGIPFNRIDLFNDSQHLTQSLVHMRLHMYDCSNLTVMFSDKPIRIMDADIDSLFRDRRYEQYSFFSVWGYAHTILEETYGPVEEWDVSFVRNMSYWFAHFEGEPDFNRDISKWDVSSVRNMDCMFSCNKKFNQPINGWDVSNAVSMQDMFIGCVQFYQVLDKWNVSNVRNMKNMFDDGCLVSREMTNWDTSLAYTDGMFSV